MNTAVYSTGDKILNVMKEMDMSIPGLAELSGIHENTPFKYPCRDKGAGHRDSVQDCGRTRHLRA